MQPTLVAQQQERRHPERTWPTPPGPARAADPLRAGDVGQIVEDHVHVGEVVACRDEVGAHGAPSTFGQTKRPVSLRAQGDRHCRPRRYECREQAAALGVRWRSPVDKEDAHDVAASDSGHRAPRRGGGLVTLDDRSLTPVFDADGHVVEPDSTWTDHLPAKFRNYLPQVIQYDDHFRFICNDRIGMRIYGKYGSRSRHARLRDTLPIRRPGLRRRRSNPMRACSTWTPTRSASPPTLPGNTRADPKSRGVTEPEPAMALCRAINELAGRLLRPRPAERLLGVGVLPPQTSAPRTPWPRLRRCVPSNSASGVDNSGSTGAHFAGTTHLHDPAIQSAVVVPRGGGRADGDPSSG